MSAKIKKPKKGDWTVKAEMTSTVSVLCQNCTEAEAEANPFAHTKQPVRHIERLDWEVLEIEPA